MKNKFLVTIILVTLYSGSTAQGNKKNNGFHTFLGVDVDNNSAKTNGLYINGVYKGFAAEKAKLKRGDTLKAINDKPVHSFNELVKTLDQYDAGQNVTVSFIRNNQLQKLSAHLNDYPEFLKYNSITWINELQDKGISEIRRARLGVEVEPVWDKYAVEVTGFIDNSPAKQAGLEKGDIIMKMNDYEFATTEELKYNLSQLKPGDVANLTIMRNGRQQSIPVKLGEEIYRIFHKEKDKMKDKQKDK